ncbi:hypothetical protein L1887_25546 [Cichorium endivia]|nr:hypothetical protein L1887_25546 [Cichorium endivia]
MPKVLIGILNECYNVIFVDDPIRDFQNVILRLLLDHVQPNQTASNFLEDSILLNLDDFKYLYELTTFLPSTSSAP